MKKSFFKKYLIMLLIIYGCNDDRNALGIYSTENGINTIDTLILEKGGVYKRVLRRKTDNSLIFKNKGAWYFSEIDNRIELTDYLLDNDEKYKIRQSYNYFDDVLMNASLPFYVEKTKSFIIIDDNINLTQLENTNA